MLIDSLIKIDHRQLDEVIKTLVTSVSESNEFIKDFVTPIRDKLDNVSQKLKKIPLHDKQMIELKTEMDDLTLVWS